MNSFFSSVESMIAMGFHHNLTNQMKTKSNGDFIISELAEGY